MRGIVTKITDNSVFVEIDQISTTDCDSCSKCGSGCATCAMKPSEKTIIEGKLASDEMSVQIGEEVQIEISPNKKIASSAILFLIPILVLLGTFKLSLYFTKNELFNALAAIIGFIISVFIIVMLFKNNSIKNTFKPTVTKIHFE